MQAAIDRFNENIGRARSLSELAESLSRLITDAVDLTDILRASLVLSVSALDNFVHEFVRLGMLEVHRGNRPITDAHISFKIPLSAVKVGIMNNSQDDWLDQAIREAHCWISFQHPDKIADAIRLISPVKLWERVAFKTGMTAADVKTQLNAIVDRRNKIAHEADMDPTNPGHRWPINIIEIRNAIEFLEKIANAIFEVA
jgi:RiboL-PSP-HEPN